MRRGMSKESETYTEGRYDSEGHGAGACARECVLNASDEGGMVETVDTVGEGGEFESKSSQPCHWGVRNLSVPRVSSD